MLDTNAVSRLLRGDQAVARLVRTASELVFSVVVIGELVHGYRAGRRYEKNVAVLRKLLGEPFAEPRELTFETAEAYGRIQAQLQARGTPIPTNDVWIAAHTIETGAELWTSDRHFEAVDGLLWRHLV